MATFDDLGVVPEWSDEPNKNLSLYPDVSRILKLFPHNVDQNSGELLVPFPNNVECLLSTRREPYLRGRNVRTPDVYTKFALDFIKRTSKENWMPYKQLPNIKKLPNILQLKIDAKFQSEFEKYLATFDDLGFEPFEWSDDDHEPIPVYPEVSRILKLFPHIVSPTSGQLVVPLPNKVECFLSTDKAPRLHGTEAYLTPDTYLKFALEFIKQTTEKDWRPYWVPNCLRLQIDANFEREYKKYLSNLAEPI